jgi:TolB-like protein
LLVLLPAVDAPAGRRAGPSLGVVPFVDQTGEAGATSAVMLRVRNHLRHQGFQVVSNGRVERYLREHRIRARSALSREQAAGLAEMLGVRYLLVGTIDAWGMNGGPEVGLTARMMDPQTGEVVWAGAVCLHAVDVPGLLAEGRPTTRVEALWKAVSRLFDTLELRKDDGTLRPVRKRERPARSAFAERPIAYRSPLLDRMAPLKVAVLPLANRTTQPEAPVVVGDRLVAWLLTMADVEVVDPGEVRRVLIERNIQPLYGLDVDKMREMGQALELDAVIDGTVLTFENGHRPVPVIDLFVRLRDARTGDVLWSATTRRDGERTRTLYDIGRIRGMDRLADAAVADLLSTWFR